MRVREVIRFASTLEFFSKDIKPAQLHAFFILSLIRVIYSRALQKTQKGGQSTAIRTKSTLTLKSTSYLKGPKLQNFSA